MTRPPITTSLQVAWPSVETSGFTTYTSWLSTTQTTTITPPPITQACFSYFNVNITDTNSSSMPISVMPSITQPPFVITDNLPSGATGVNGSSQTRTFTPPPYFPATTSTSSGLPPAIWGWGGGGGGGGGGLTWIEGPPGPGCFLFCGLPCLVFCWIPKPCLTCWGDDFPDLDIPDPNFIDPWPPTGPPGGGGGGGGPGGEPQSEPQSEGESSTEKSSTSSSTSSCATTLTAPEVLVSCMTNNVTSSCQTISSIEVTGCDVSPTTTTEYATSTTSCASLLTAPDVFVSCMTNNVTSSCQTISSGQVTGCDVSPTTTTEYATSSCASLLTAPEVLVSCFSMNSTSFCQTASSIQVTGCDVTATATTAYASCPSIDINDQGSCGDNSTLTNFTTTATATNTTTSSCATTMTASEVMVSCFSMNSTAFCQTANATLVTGCGVTASITTAFASCPSIDPDDQGSCGTSSQNITNTTMTATNTTTRSCVSTMTAPEVLVSCLSMGNGTQMCNTATSINVTGCDVTASVTTAFASCPSIDPDDQGSCGNGTTISNTTMTNTTMTNTTMSSTQCATPLTVPDIVVSCFSMNSTAFCETAATTMITGCNATATATTSYAACPALDPDDDQGENGNGTLPFNVTASFNSSMTSTASNSTITECATTLTAPDYVVSCFSMNSTAFCETATTIMVTGCNASTTATTTFAACPVLDPDDPQGEDGNGNTTAPLNVTSSFNSSTMFNSSMVNTSTLNTITYTLGNLSLPATVTGATEMYSFGMYTMVFSTGSVNATVIKPRPLATCWPDDLNYNDAAIGPETAIGTGVATTGPYASEATGILAFPTGMCNYGGYWECPAGKYSTFDAEMYCSEVSGAAREAYCAGAPTASSTTCTVNGSIYEATLGYNCKGPQSCGVNYPTPTSEPPHTFGIYQVTYKVPMGTATFTIQRVQPWATRACVTNINWFPALEGSTENQGQGSATATATMSPFATTPGTMVWPTGMCNDSVPVTCEPDDPDGYQCYASGSPSFSCNHVSTSYSSDCTFADNPSAYADVSMLYRCIGGPACDRAPITTPPSSASPSPTPPPRTTHTWALWSLEYIDLTIPPVLNPSHIKRIQPYPLTAAPDLDFRWFPASDPDASTFASTFGPLLWTRGLCGNTHGVRCIGDQDVSPITYSCTDETDSNLNFGCSFGSTSSTDFTQTLSDIPYLIPANRFFTCKALFACNTDKPLITSKPAQAPESSPPESLYTWALWKNNYFSGDEPGFPDPVESVYIQPLPTGATSWDMSWWHADDDHGLSAQDFDTVMTWGPGMCGHAYPFTCSGNPVAQRDFTPSTYSCTHSADQSKGNFDCSYISKDSTLLTTGGVVTYATLGFICKAPFDCNPAKPQAKQIALTPPSQAFTPTPNNHTTHVFLSNPKRGLDEAQPKVFATKVLQEPVQTTSPRSLPQRIDKPVDYGQAICKGKEILDVVGSGNVAQSPFIDYSALEKGGYKLLPTDVLDGAFDTMWPTLKVSKSNFQGWTIAVSLSAFCTVTLD